MLRKYILFIKFSFVVYKSLRMEKCVANDTRIEQGSSFEFLENG